MFKYSEVSTSFDDVFSGLLNMKENKEGQNLGHQGRSSQGGGDEKKTQIKNRYGVKTRGSQKRGEVKKILNKQKLG